MQNIYTFMHIVRFLRFTYVYIIYIVRTGTQYIYCMYIQYNILVFASVYCHIDLVLFQMYYAYRVHIYVTYMERFGQTKSEKFNQIYCLNKNCSQRRTTRTYVRNTRIYTNDSILVEVEICNKPQRLLSTHVHIHMV